MCKNLTGSQKSPIINPLVRSIESYLWKTYTDTAVYQISKIDLSSSTIQQIMAEQSEAIHLLKQ